MSKKTVKCPKCGKTWQTSDARKTVCDNCRLDDKLKQINSYNKEHGTNVSYGEYDRVLQETATAKNTTHVVFAVHSKTSLKYLFRTRKPLKKGDVVATSQDPAICVCGSFELPEDALEIITHYCGAKQPLADIQGVYRLEEFTS